MISPPFLYIFIVSESPVHAQPSSGLSSLDIQVFLLRRCWPRVEWGWVSGTERGQGIRGLMKPYVCFGSCSLRRVVTSLCAAWFVWVFASLFSLLVFCFFNFWVLVAVHV